MYVCTNLHGNRVCLVPWRCIYIRVYRLVWDRLRQLIMSLSMYITHCMHCENHFNCPPLPITSIAKIFHPRTIPTSDHMFYDVVEAHAMALNQTGTLLSDHTARGVNWSESLTSRVFVSHKTVWWLMKVETPHCNLSSLLRDHSTTSTSPPCNCF